MMNRELIVAALRGDMAAASWLDAMTPDWRQNACAIITLTDVVNSRDGTRGRRNAVSGLPGHHRSRRRSGKA